MRTEKNSDHTAKICTCACGFSWRKGQSGTHRCGPFYAEKVDGLKQVIADQAKCLKFVLLKIEGEDMPSFKEIVEAENSLRKCLGKVKSVD
jgi:hypothetical protein